MEHRKGHGAGWSPGARYGPRQPGRGQYHPRYHPYAHAYQPFYPRACPYPYHSKASSPSRVTQPSQPSPPSLSLQPLKEKLARIESLAGGLGYSSRKHYYQPRAKSHADLPLRPRLEQAKGTREPR
jgi:hypothetical protein